MTVAVLLATSIGMASTITMHAQAPAVRASRLDTSASVIAFINVAVIPMDTEQVLPGQTVLVQGNRITALGPMARVPVPPGAERIDGQGKFLLPGLADMHAHLGFSQTVADAERALFLYAANGVTTIRNMDYLRHGTSGCRMYMCQRVKGEDLLKLRARAATGELWSPRIYTSGPWFSDQHWWETVSFDSIEHYLLAYKTAGYDFIKPHEERDALLDSLTVIGRRVGLTLQGHAPSPTSKSSSAKALLERTLSTYRSIEHLTGYPAGLHGMPLRDSVEIPGLVAATKRAGVWNCPTLRFSATRPRNALEARYARAELRRMWKGIWGIPDAELDKYVNMSDPARSFPPLSPQQLVEINLQGRLIKELQHAGAGILLGTDVPVGVSPYGYAVHHELESMVQAGLTPYEALVTSTRNVATFYGTLDSVGTVTAGKRADLVLLSANPLVDIRNSGQVAGVMVAGRWLPVVAIEQRLAAYYPEGSQPARGQPAATPRTPE